MAEMDGVNADNSVKSQQKSANNSLKGASLEDVLTSRQDPPI
jgi:hypothetical protein